MRISVAFMLVLVLFVAEPISCQRLPRTRSRLSTAEAEATAKLKAKTSTEAASNTTSTTPSTEASPPSPNPSPPPPSSAKPSAKDGANATSNKTSSTTTTPTPELTSPASSSVAPPVSSVQVRMAFSPSKKVPEAPKRASKEDDPKTDAKPNKASDTQESTKESSKKPSTTTTSSPTSTSTAKPPAKSPSTKKPDQDDELRDALKRIHQEVLKQPRSQETKNKSSNSTTTKKPPRDENVRGLDTAESTYVRPPAVNHRVEETDPAPLDAQPSIQSTKFVLREQGLQQLPSFVRSKDRTRPTATNTVKHILLQKQPLIVQQQQQLQHRQRSDPIDEEAITSTTSTTAYPHIPIVHFDKEQSADGSYKTSYETGNNIFAEETGFLKNPGVEGQEALVQQGSYSYTAPDGSLISVTYQADELGFRASGSHIPTPPPEIRRSLDIIYAQIQRDEEEAAREAELERQGEASETHEESLSPPTTGSKRESRRYLPMQDDQHQY